MIRNPSKMIRIMIGVTQYNTPSTAAIIIFAMLPALESAWRAME